MHKMTEHPYHFKFKTWIDVICTYLILSKGWQTSCGHKRWIFVDKIGEFSWTLLVNSCGHFVLENSSFWVNWVKNVHEKFTQKEDFSWTKCPQEVTKSVHEKSLILSTKIHLLCPREVWHPFKKSICGSLELIIEYMIILDITCGLSIMEYPETSWNLRNFFGKKRIYVQIKNSATCQKLPQPISWGFHFMSDTHIN